MKKNISLFLIAVLILNICPISLNGVFDFSTKVVAAENDKPVLIYMAEDFETQELNDLAYGFWPYGSFVENDTRCFGGIVERNGNKSNKAAVFQSANSGQSVFYLPFFYAPLERNYVLDFKFNTGTASKIDIAISYNQSNVSHAGQYLEPEHKTENAVISISPTSINVGNTTVKTGLTGSTWHRFQMVHDIENDTVDVYIDGSLAKRNLTFLSVDNVSSYRFYTPTLNGTEKTKYYIDDVNVYLSDSTVSDTKLSTALAGYTDSGIRPEPRYQMGFLSQYSNYVYDMFYNEFVMSGISSRRVYKDNRFYDLPISTYIENNITYVPIRAFAEMMGATVEYNDGVITISYNGKTMKVTEGGNVYYVDNKPANLRYPIQMVNGYATINLDILCNFLGISYVRYSNTSSSSYESYDIISFTGELTTDYSLLGTDANTKNKRTLRNELICRMMELLQNDTPTAATLRSMYSEKYPSGGHPHVLINDFVELKDKYNNSKDSKYKTVVDSFISQADAILGDTSINVNSINSENTYRHLLKAAFAWNMTSKTKYKDFINKKIDILYEYATVTYPSLASKPNSLAQGNSCIGLGILYDWMYNSLDADRLEKMKTVVKKMGIDWYDTQFRTPAMTSTAENVYEYGNQPILINMGGISTALALFDEYPERASQVASLAIRSSVPAFRDFAPAGGWAEGISYWQYAVDTMPLTINSLDAAFGTDFGLYSMQGVNKTSEYALSVKGNTSTYPTGDAEEQASSASVYMLEAKKNNDIAKAVLRINDTNYITITDIVNWVFLDDNNENVKIQTDYYMPKIENVLLKADNASTGTSVLLHGGGVNDSHGHEDNGTFMFDMLGYRWASDVGREDYNLYSFGDYVGRTNEDPNKAYTDYNKFDYYRDGAEGHNTVIANLGATRNAMQPKAKSNIIAFDSSDIMSYGIVDMTQTNAIYDCATRGIKLDKVNNEIIIHDSFKATEPTDFYWLMHTEANIQISADGRSAILSADDDPSKRIWMGIISNDNYVIQAMAPEHLGNFPKAKEGEIMRPSGYENSIIRPPLETPVDAPLKQIGFASEIKKGFKRLTIQTTEDTNTFDIMVAFKPLSSGQTQPSVMPTASRSETWSTKTRTSSFLDMIKVNGTEIEGFKANKFNYTIKNSSVPTIEAVIDEGYDVEIIPAKAVPGITSIIIKEDENVKNIYYVKINPAD